MSNNKISRRDFLTISAAGTAGLLLPGLEKLTLAADVRSRYRELIPAKKNLPRAWERSLFLRGEPQVYSGDNLKYIGMPVGGLCAGQVYLGGDGKLWLWDIFNKYVHGVCNKGRNGENYVEPLTQRSPFEQGFAIEVETADKMVAKTLNKDGFNDIEFRGEYPIGHVYYRDADLPVEIKLRAFSPFIPLDTDASSYPAAIMNYTVTNTSDTSIKVRLAGSIENPVCLHTGSDETVMRRNNVIRSKQMTCIQCSAHKPPQNYSGPKRKDILFEDFEKDNYKDWNVEGTAFGDAPVIAEDMPAYQGKVGQKGERLINSHNVRNGENIPQGDAHVGKMTSRKFTLKRRYINFLIGGGSRKDATCMNLIIDGEAVRIATGKNSNTMHQAFWDVAEYEGRNAKIEIVDNFKGGWGNIGVDHIVFSDKKADPLEEVPLQERSDFGTIALALLAGKGKDVATAQGNDKPFSISRDPGTAVDQADKPFSDKMTGAVIRELHLPPGQSETLTFLITWHFPNMIMPRFGNVGRYYATRFNSAHAVAEHIAENFDTLTETTRSWRDTWYDSTLPYWFLDRTFANISTLATSTSHRFTNGRFYAWEGVGCCEGTCTHVWHYAQAVARLFPELERILRERVDFGLAFEEDTGMVWYRGEVSKAPAYDGQAGNVLRAYREHQMSPDSSFLKRNWPRIKKAMQYLISKDTDNDGILDGAQPNTLDAAWYGQIAWISSLYNASLRAAEAMAKEMGDLDFAARAAKIAKRGADRLVNDLYNGEYFIQKPDPAHMDAIGTDSGCYIDQVIGQWWAWQVGLGRLYSQKHIKSALNSLWKYNFTKDVGPFKKIFEKGRPYALAGDGGLIMCTWPKGGKRDDWEKHWQFGYFNECMSGFEHQVAAHMIWEGMLKEGLAITRVIHDRYNAKLRNPYNEIECSDHYARAMASYGSFQAICGYEYHGPKGYIAWAPKLRPDNFRAAFTSAQGWGTISQQRTKSKQTNSLKLKWGKLKLRTLAFDTGSSVQNSKALVKINGKNIRAKTTVQGSRITLKLENEAILESGDHLEAVIG
ncbi:putative bile acid beta-glucosidase [Anaerohalosphaera lusitana]|uniref:Putative bile acid beta-glucosidase n=1 Tax=Anaerohalosphaera lusitana TaxID=1936003 RepID=A0A1U9NPA7_9BACT|nr:GH116 family glycosyl-hydrolase [Anaerohalosphaera lusitana]AQT69739.1 putative bile acid beta-glucosidase [Anaerohalosphaera lusitana]